MTQIGFWPPHQEEQSVLNAETVLSIVLSMLGTDAGKRAYITVGREMVAVASDGNGSLRVWG